MMSEVHLKSVSSLNSVGCSYVGFEALPWKLSFLPFCVKPSLETRLTAFLLHMVFALPVLMSLMNQGRTCTDYLFSSFAIG